MVEEKKNIPKVRFREFAGDDANAWELRKLKEILEINPKTEKIPDIFEYVDLGSVVGTDLIKHTKTLKESAPSRAQRLAKKGDVFYQTVRPYQKNNYLYELQYNNYIFSTGYAQLRPYSGVDSNFLLNCVQEEKFVTTVLNFCTGTSYPAINSKDLGRVMIKIPKSTEQQKIGDFFKHLDELITLHQRELDNYKMLKKTMLSKMFPKNDEKYPEIRFTGFAYAWELRKLGEVAKRYDNLRIPISEGKRERGNIPYYGANGIQDYVKGFTHQGEFVLVAEDGANDVINYPVRYVEGKIWVNNHAHVLQGKKDILDNHFLTYIIKSIKIAPFLVGGSRSKLNSNTMMNMSINVAPFREQQKIGTLFKHLDSLITLHQRELESLKTLKKNLLQQMFV
ncbi:restriction endonuclease subunit S [Ligilactobacillus murinus]|uniref:restriction endonuclease subunit S n=2 Tax=Ligilactobacillus murinus TaxID=1622 RepID=UPI001C3ED834|nr:restriction endonuclease subunit S [Ligilactobacillus murinus]